jgi:hypothetical protein
MPADELIQPLDDKLVCPEVGGWTEDVSLYAKLFSSGMKDKWSKRIYVELYGGAGYSRVRDTSKIILGSPLRALTLEHPFDKYVFCEAVPENLEALKARVNRHAPTANVAYVEGDTVICVRLISWPKSLGDRGTTLFSHSASPTPMTLASSSVRSTHSQRAS